MSASEAPRKGSHPAVELRGLVKRFGELTANADINLSVRAGSIHAIIGENGAGKSTAMKMLYGIYRPDAGEIRIDGEVREWASPREAIAAGIGMVHQHFMLAGPYDAIENIVVGVESGASFPRWLPLPFRRIDRLRAERDLRELSSRYGLKVPFDEPVEDLPVGVQQRIEILKVLYRNARIIILDEPTAVLTPQETQELFANLKRLAAEGKTVVIITHKLKEVMAIADRVTVFRAGRVVGEVETAGTSKEELASLMVGRKVSLTAEVPPQPKLGAPVLELQNVSLRATAGAARETVEHKNRLEGLSFQVRAGEVVGIAGVEGNGQTELLQLVLHSRDFQARADGTIRVLGQPTLLDHRGWGAGRIKELGVGVVPEDRLHEGLLLESDLRENFLLGQHRRQGFSRFGFVARAFLDERTRRAIGEYDVRPASAVAVAGRLSGGNQQKIVIAREFENPPKLLVAAQPTRGVDVGAIEFIHSRILRARTEGAGVLLVSSELDEILNLSDRILVMYEGRIVAEFARGAADEGRLGLCMGGAVGV